MFYFIIQMGLSEYKSKRKLHKTPEPAGGKPAGNTLHFVVQKHQASHLHYDFRLELKGVLKSWAVPKGPSMDTEIRRTAIMVEDHPYDYINFEGNIPEGNYGAGSVIIWDQGTFEPVEKKKTKLESENYLLHNLYQGKVEFILKGKKLKGRFALIKQKGRAENAWLLLKQKDKFAKKADVLKQDRSVVSRLTVDEMANNTKARTWQSNRTADGKEKPVILNAKEINSLIRKGKKTPMPSHVRPMKCGLIDEPFDNEEWIFELKLDGYRIVAMVNGEKIKLTTTELQDYTKKYFVVADALQQLDHKVILDGEVVALNDEGKPDFSKLQNYKGEGNLVYYVFDLLWIDGYDIMLLPLVERKQILQSILPPKANLVFVDHVEQQGEAFFELVKEKELEGIVCKEMDSVYHPGVYTKSWLKLPNQIIREYVIVGWRESEHQNLYARLMYGEYRDGKLYYLHHTGSRPSHELEKAAYAALKNLEVKKKTVVNEVGEETPVHWVKPVKVGRFKFKNLKETIAGKPRHPVIFLGFRDDKSPKNITTEKPIDVDKAIEDAKEEQVETSISTRDHNKKFNEVEVWKQLHPGMEIEKKFSLEVEGTKLTIINDESEYWLGGIQKQHVLFYYNQVADFVLKYLKDRPIGLNIAQKWAGDAVFIRNAAGLYPNWVETFSTERRVKKKEKSEDVDWVICNDKATLFYLLNLGAVDFHPWAARRQKPNYPDYIVIDLDPPKRADDEKTEKSRKEDKRNLVNAALTAKKIFDELGLTAFVKTSGQSGLHVLIPCQQIAYGKTRPIAQKLADKIHTQIPAISTTEVSTGVRNNKLYIDASQNDYSDRIAVAYSIRAYKQPTISTPLNWEEITNELDVREFKMKTVIQRLKKIKDPFDRLLDAAVQKANSKILNRI
jgi:bifunctional non-homologous end joining protein LigD